MPLSEKFSPHPLTFGKLDGIDGVTLSVAYMWVLPLESLGVYVAEISSLADDPEENKDKLEKITSDCMELVLYLFNSLEELKESFHSAVSEPDENQSNVEAIKLSLLAEISASVAHLWREPLSLVHINMQNIREELSSGREDAAYLHQCLDASSSQLENMRSAVDMFIRFVSNDRVQDADLMQVLDSLHDFLSVYYEKDGIGFVFHSDPSQIIIKCSPSVLRQVLLSIFMKSRSIIEKSPRGVGVVNFRAIKGGIIEVESASGTFDSESEEMILNHVNGGNLYTTAKIIKDVFGGILDVLPSEKGTLFRITLS